METFIYSFVALYLSLYIVKLYITFGDLKTVVIARMANGKIPYTTGEETKRYKQALFAYRLGAGLALLFFLIPVLKDERMGFFRSKTEKELLAIVNSLNKTKGK